MNIKTRIDILKILSNEIDYLWAKCDVISEAGYYTDEEKTAQIFAIHNAIEIIAKAAEGV